MAYSSDFSATCSSSLKFVTITNTQASLVISSGDTSAGKAFCPVPGSGVGPIDVACTNHRPTFIDAGTLQNGVSSTVTVYAAGLDGGPLAGALISVVATRVPDTVSFFQGPLQGGSTYYPSTGVFQFGEYLTVAVPTTGTGADGVASISITVGAGKGPLVLMERD